MKGLNIANIW